MPDARSTRPGRISGIATTVGVLVAAGMATLAGAPDAGADDFDIGAWFDPDVMSTAAETAFRQLVVDPIHDGIEDWIHSDLGQQIDTAINQLSGLYLIGDGDPGTAENPDGGVGGLWFGDGGDGWDATGAGQAGGDGGAALSLFGVGGDGG
ncbi:MAG: hypothetical protein M3Y90_11300, partial [Actinomycetota bacterium]|nr:hypothetical protein [Actinomycetota bacterium]